MALIVRDLRVKLGGKEILSGLSLKLTAKKISAIIGPNGAGKSTLLRAMAGLVSYRGEVTLEGQNIKGLSRRNFARQLGFLPQSPPIPSDITVETLVDYGRFPYRSLLGRSDPKDDREAVDFAIDACNLESFRFRRVASLSGGEQRRVFIAMAVAGRPRYLLLDEPTTYLDIAHQIDVLKLLTKINRDLGMTIIMVLHDINHALWVADEIAVIKNGSVFLQGETKKLLTASLVTTVFGVESDIFTNSQGATVLSPVAFLGSKGL